MSAHAWRIDRVARAAGGAVVRVDEGAPTLAHAARRLPLEAVRARVGEYAGRVAGTMKPKKFYERMFVVEGAGDFPLDMLRYDCAFPLTERDAHIAQRHEKRRVILMSRRVHDGYPTDARWRSFTWQVVGYFDERLDAEECRDALAPVRGEAGI
jgi:hypothetical protein